MNLWVRETWRTGVALDKYNTKAIAAMAAEAGWEHPWMPVIYEADGARDNWDTISDFGGEAGRIRQSIYMPRWASRITLAVTSVRVERLQEITEEDAKAEGVESGAPWSSHRDEFALLWNAINERAPWSSNPWLWVVGFELMGGAL